MNDVVIVTTLWDGVPCQCVEIGPIYVEIFFSYADTDDKSGIKMNPSILEHTEFQANGETSLHFRNLSLPKHCILG